MRPSRRPRIVDVATFSVFEVVVIVAVLATRDLEMLALAVPGALRLIGALAGAFSVVQVADDQVVVRNRWRRHIVPARSVRRVVVMETEDEDDEGASPLTLLWNRRVAAPELALEDGRRVRCQAMASRRRRRDGDAPTAAHLRAAVLRRWLDLPPE